MDGPLASHVRFLRANRRAHVRSDDYTIRFRRSLGQGSCLSKMLKESIVSQTTIRVVMRQSRCCVCCGTSPTPPVSIMHDDEACHRCERVAHHCDQLKNAALKTETFAGMRTAGRLSTIHGIASGLVEVGIKERLNIALLLANVSRCFHRKRKQLLTFLRSSPLTALSTLPL